MLPINEILEKINPQQRKSLSLEEYFLSLVINEKQVQAGIWDFSKDGGQSLAYGSWESWGGESAEELIVAADASIASAIANLPDVSGKQPAKVILGLPEFWVEENAIRKEKLEILQIVCKKLLLKPLGFVVTPEAIAHLLKRQERGSSNLILVNIDESEIMVSLIIQGKFLGSKIVGRSNSLALDLEEGLLRFNFEGALPARIMLLGDKTLEEEKQALISYPWIAPDNEKKLGFLQFPKVEIAEENFEMASVVLAGSHELGEEERRVPPSESETKEVLLEESKVEEESFATPLLKENFGFIKGEDILMVASLKETAREEAKEEFVEEGEQKKLEEPEQEKEVMPQSKAFSQAPRFRKFRFSLGIKEFINRLKNFLAFFFRKGFLVIVMMLVALLGTTLLIFTKIAKSEVKLLVQAQKIEKEFEFTVSAKVNSVDSEKMILPGREISLEVVGKKSSEVKGKKTVGDKATGEAIIYNGTDKARTFVKGAGLKGPGGLKFVLKQETVVPARATDLNARPLVDKWGEKKASVEAVEIGAQYNIAAKSSLALESLPSSPSSFLVENPTAFSGGNSREIQAISKEDRENLQREIAQELEIKASQEIKSKISSTDHLLEDSVQLKSKGDHFDGEVGDETSTISVEAKYVFSALFFKEEDFKNLVEKVISPLVAEGYQKQPVKQEESFFIKDKDKGIYSAKVREEVLPEIETGKVAKELKAKRFSWAESYLKSLPWVIGVEISFQPKIFSGLKFFPLKEKNITVRVKAI